MKKNFRTVKASIVMGILLVSIFAVFMPSASAGIIFPLPSQVTLKIEPVDAAQLNQLVKPLEPIVIEIRIGYLVTGLFAQQAIDLLSGRFPASISLSIEETPSWCSASVDRNVVSPEIKTGWSYDTAYLRVSFKENVPARLDVPITIKMQSQAIESFLFVIKGKTEYGTITVTPQFLPIIDATPKTTFQEVAPGELATFEIELENLGNAKTEFIFKIGDLPEDWVASIPANKFVDSIATGGNPKATVRLIVTPPYGFGYHDKTQEIRFLVKGQYFAGPGEDVMLETVEYEHILTVRNRGFSTPGFEAVFVIFALVGIAFIVKKRKKTK